MIVLEHPASRNPWLPRATHSMTIGLPPSWATDESHADLWLEQAINAGVNLGSMAYGIHLAAFFTCSYYLFQAKKFSWFYQTYITVLLSLATVNIACNIRFNELAWVDERNYPGGPLAFILEQESVTPDTVGDAAANAITFLVDTLLIYRCYIIWDSKWYVIILPCLGLVTSTVLSILRTIAAAQPASSLFAQNAVRFGLPYWIISMTVNISVTALIITRLLLARKRLRLIMGPSSGQTYTSIVAMMVESAFPYAIIGIILIALYASNNTADVLFIPILPHVQCITPELIILRVNRGRGWSKNMLTSSTAMTSIRFDTRGLSSKNTLNANETQPSTIKAEELPAFVVASNHSLDVMTAE